MRKVWFSFQGFLCLKYLRERELQWILFINMFTIDIEKKYKPIEMCLRWDIFYFLSQSTVKSTLYLLQSPTGDYLKIQRMKKLQSRSHFVNDTNGRYDVQKSDLEVVLTWYERANTNVRKSDLEVILMIRMEDTTFKKVI